MPKFIFTKKPREYTKHEKEVYARFLSERLYGSVTILAINIGLLLNIDGITVRQVFTTIFTTALGLWLASLFAEEVSHKVVHGKTMDAHEFRVMMVSHLGIILAALPSLFVVGLIFFKVIVLRTAIEIGISITATTILLYIIRSINIQGRSRTTSLISVFLQILVAALVIVIKLVAH